MPYRIFCYCQNSCSSMQNCLNGRIFGELRFHNMVERFVSHAEKTVFNSKLRTSKNLQWIFFFTYEVKVIIFYLFLEIFWEVLTSLIFTKFEFQFQCIPVRCCHNLYLAVNFGMNECSVYFCFVTKVKHPFFQLLKLCLK